MPFKKYQHIERFGTDETNNIELGECFIFPKIDGTNASIWFENGKINAGSRKRHLTLEKDNGGFLEWVLKQDNIKAFFGKYPHLRLYGEWLIPHSLKTYREDAWEKFYVFDVTQDIENDEVKYIHYNIYSEYLKEFDIEFIRPICTILNGGKDQFISQLEKNNYLIKDGSGLGEGIVIKNYDFVNQRGNTKYAKIVTSEFKEKHNKVMGHSTIKGKKMVEFEIVEKYVTKALCEKVHAKIKNESGWNSKMIPRLLNTVYYDLVNEECWHFIKDHKNPIIDFGKLVQITYKKVKDHLPELF